MLKKSERNALKEKPLLTTNVTVESKIDSFKTAIKPPVKATAPQKLPLLLPKSNANDKKGKFYVFLKLLFRFTTGVVRSANAFFFK